MNIEIHNGKELLVIDKPAKKEVKKFAEELAEQYPSLQQLPRYGLAHRLDKGTSGVLLFGKNKKILQQLKKQFKKRKIKKEYLGLAWKSMTESPGKVTTSMKRSPANRLKHASYSPETEGRKAISRFEIVENFDDFSYLRIKPKTGRRHQIRSQLAYLGHPIAGDELYRFKDQKDPEKLDRQFLHNYLLEVTINKRTRRFISELPEKLKKVKSNLQCPIN